MKHSPICTRDEGREIYFTVTHEAGRYRLVVSREMLDDECGETADEAARRKWVEDNLSSVMSALTARTGGGYVREPWSRVVVEELE